MILIADLHAGKEADSFLTSEGMPSQRRDLRDALNYVAAEALHTKQALVIAGDIFNRLNPTTDVISEWFAFLRRFPTVQFYVIPGNHDAGTDRVNMQMVDSARLDNVHVYTEPYNTIVEDSTGSAKVSFYPHIPLAYRDSALSLEAMMMAGNEVVADFAVTHGQVSASDYRNDIFFEAGDALPIDLAKIPGLVFSGHIHNQGEYVGKSGRVVYPGSLTINNFGEVDERKGYISIPLDDPQKYVLKELPAMGTPWQHIEIDLTDKDETSLDEKKIAEVAKDAIIKVTIFAKQYGVVNEAAVRELFNRYGHVTRLETKVTENVTEVTDRQQMTTSHEKLLLQWISEQDEPVKVKTQARKIGEELIVEVLG